MKTTRAVYPSLVLLSLVTSSCATGAAHIPTSSTMEVRRAREVISGSLLSPSTRIYFVGEISRVRVDDVRFRNDGLAVLWRKGSSPQTVTACYYSAVQPRAEPLPLMLAAVRLCTLSVQFERFVDAQNFADALYTLKTQ